MKEETKILKDIFNWENICEWEEDGKGVFNEKVVTLNFYRWQFAKLLKKYPHLNKMFLTEALNCEKLLNAKPPKDGIVGEI